MDHSSACLVVLSYEGRALLDRTLPSIVSQRYADLEVVVVDNGSSDGTVEYLQEWWPTVRIVALRSNVGVTAALNVCVRCATGFDYVGLLNNDVELEPDWTSTLVAALESHPAAAAAAGKLLRYSDRCTIDRVGDVVHWSGAAFGRGAAEFDSAQYELAEEVFAVGGAAALYRTTAFAHVGLFDERFFAYLEDVDWGFRARLAGLVARYEPQAVGYHMGGATLGEVNPFSLYHLRRNTIWLVVKNHPGASLVRHGWTVLAFLLVGLALAARSGHGRLVLRAYADAVRGLPGVMKDRRSIQGRRRIEPRALESMIPRRVRLW